MSTQDKWQSIQPNQPQPTQPNQLKMGSNQPNKSDQFKVMPSEPMPEPGQPSDAEQHRIRQACSIPLRPDQPNVGSNPDQHQFEAARSQPSQQPGQSNDDPEQHRFRRACSQPLQPDQPNLRSDNPDQHKFRTAHSHVQPGKPSESDNQIVMSPEEVERIISYVEKEYGAEVSSEVRKVVREEISSAVPELTRVLLPLFTAEEGNSAPNSEELQQECVKAFLHIMVPHMQKIVRAVQ